MENKKEVNDMLDLDLTMYQWKDLLRGDFNSERMKKLVESNSYIDLNSGKLVSEEGLETYPNKTRLKLFNEVTTKDLVEFMDLLSNRYWEFLKRDKIDIDNSNLSDMNINLKELRNMINEKTSI